jgi:hypothetical protein
LSKLVVEPQTVVRRNLHHKRSFASAGGRWESGEAGWVREGPYQIIVDSKTMVLYESICTTLLEALSPLFLQLEKLMSLHARYSISVDHSCRHHTACWRNLLSWHDVSKKLF